MATKVQNKKSIRLKNNKTTRRADTAKIAAICECAESTVRRVLQGKRSGNTELGQKILIASSLLHDNENLLLKEIKRRVNL